ncbi:MAG: TonB-dependent receptor [Agriterribacter sp.]
MKLTIVLIIAACLQVSAKGFAQQITLQEKNISVQQLFEKIRVQTGYKFFYADETLAHTTRLDINVVNGKLEEVLDAIVKKQQLTYNISEKTIIVKKNTNAIVTIAVSEAEQAPITGKVTNEQGEPLEGATVLVKGTSNGTKTGADGSFSLNAEPGATLVISYVGLESTEIKLGRQLVVAVTLKPAVTQDTEVLVVGYGTQRKKDLTGSVVRINMEEKANQANVNLLQALVGASAGVNLEGRGGAASEPTLSIRGQTSLSASDRPLIVLDGVIYNGSISNININDVESIDILKDASAAAVYGARSANGVLLITTKTGKSKTPVITIGANAGYQDMTNNPMRVMNADEFALRLLDWDHQSKVYAWYATKPTSADGRPVRPDASDPEVIASYLKTFEEKENYLAGNKVDWVKEVLRVAPMQNYNVGIQGSANKTTYYFSGSYSNVQGIQLNDKFKRITVHSNVESQVRNWLTLGINASYNYRDNSGVAASLSDARVASPLANNYIGKPVYDIYLGGELFQPYPLVNLYINNSDISNELFAVGRAKVSVPWVQGLKYEFNYSHVFTSAYNNSFHSTGTPQGVSNRGLAVKSPAESRDWIVNNIITYSRDFGEHSVNSTLLFSREKRTGNATTASAQGFDNPVLGYNNLGLGEVATSASSAYEENSLSYMARINYGYRSRYLFTATIRRDGFSGFGAGNKWATFPSASVAWVLSEEPFLKGHDVYLKLRTSYGKNGNQGIGRYSSLSRMGTRYYVYGEATAIGIYPSSLGNRDLAWETTSSYNLGFDFGFLKRRISGSVDLYTASTKDVLVQRQLPRSAGYASIWTNIGGIRNKGIEVELKTINLEGVLNWQSNFVFALNRDKITKLYGGDKDNDIGNSWFVGKSINAIYDYEMAGGVWTEDEFFKGQVLNGWYPGQFRYVDINGDGAIDPNNDRKVVGYTSPSYRFSINNSLTYKNFTLSILINSVQGGKNYYLANNAEMINPLFYFPERRNNSAINAYWTPDAPTTNTTGIYNVPLRQSGIYQSRSFVRLQDVSLAYSFGKKLLDKINMQSAQVYISSKNPYVWTKWQGWDPEIGVSDTPLMRNIIAGVRLSF